ncbi:MAG: hypothetical protein QM477_08290 [Planctomycetota bacterium]
MFFLPLIALVVLPITQEPSSDSPYFAPDWIPGTTELYYGPSFFDRNYREPVDLVVKVDLGLVNFHARQLPMGGAEHLGALFFALDEEEVEAGFPMNVEDSSVVPQCPALTPPAENATAADSAGAGWHQES